MNTLKSAKPSRRGFLLALGGVFPGIILGRPTDVGAVQKNAKAFLKGVEWEVLEASKPIRDPSIATRIQDEGVVLHRNKRGRLMRVCSMNPTGKAIWEACNGKNTPEDISKLIQKKYSVSSRQAHTDCLTFLVSLKKRGAIRI